jgi:hypothetical protein
MKILDIKHFILSHLIWIVGVAVLLLGFHSWQGEHDARLLAAQEEKVAETQVKSLEAQISERDKQVTVQTAPIIKIIHDVKTVPEVIGALPTVMTRPLPQPIVQQSSGIKIPELDVIPLFDQVADDKVCRSLLDTSSNDLADTRGIVKQKDDEIKALKKPKSFWSRTKSTLKVIGIGVGIGVVLGSKL